MNHATRTSEPTGFRYFYDLVVFVLAESLFFSTLGKPPESISDRIQFLAFVLAMLAAARIVLNVITHSREAAR